MSIDDLIVLSKPAGHHRQTDVVYGPFAESDG